MTVLEQRILISITLAYSLANPSPRGPLGLRGLTLALFGPLRPTLANPSTDGPSWANPSPIRASGPTWANPSPGPTWASHNPSPICVPGAWHKDNS